MVRFEERSTWLYRGAEPSFETATLIFGRPKATHRPKATPRVSACTHSPTPCIYLVTGGVVRAREGRDETWELFTPVSH